MDTDRLVTQLTYERSAPELAQYYEGMGPRTEDIERAMKMVDAHYPEPRVVEIGCGSGRDAEVILQSTSEYIGFDISPTMVGLARSRNHCFKFNVADVASFKFPPRADIVFAFASLVHSDEAEMQDVLVRAWHALNPGGIFYISLKLGEYGSYIQEDEYGKRRFFTYTPEDLEALAGDLYETAYCDEHVHANAERFVIALRKVSNSGAIN